MAEEEDIDRAERDVSVERTLPATLLLLPGSLGGLFPAPIRMTSALTVNPAARLPAPAVVVVVVTVVAVTLVGRFGVTGLLVMGVGDFLLTERSSFSGLLYTFLLDSGKNCDSSTRKFGSRMSLTVGCRLSIGLV